MTKEESEKVWGLFEPFQGYGFNKAHAACYGRVAYQTAYMKAHYPAEYMCAVLTAEAGDTEKIAVMIEECQRMGTPVLAPDINSSLKDFTVVKDKASNKNQIRFGLLSIKNLGAGIAEAIIAERKNNGAFKNIDDFMVRVNNKDLNKKSLESLIRCGALDVFDERGKLLANVDTLLNHARNSHKAQASKQASLFESPGTDAVMPPLRLVEVQAARRSEKLMWEKELLGLFISDHPLKDFQMKLNFEKDLVKIKDLAPRRGPVKIGGMVTKIQKIITKTGKPMIFSVLEDLTSKIEVVVFPNILEKHPEAFQENSILVIKGSVNDRDGIPKFLCDEVRPIATLT